MKSFGTIILALVLMLSGCVSRHAGTGTADRLFFLPGATGGGPWYAGLMRGLRDGGVDEPVQAVAWGLPPPLIALNLQGAAIHRQAEAKLARLITAWRQRHPDGRITLLGHSAGGGVILGALKRLDPAVQVEQVIFLNPSVSPQYDLAPSLAHVKGTLHVFHSDRDKLLLQWGTSTFGTYDNIKTDAAGRRGFALEHLPQPLHQRIVQHPYDPAWKSLGNDGDHFGSTAQEFARQVLAPLIRRCTPAFDTRSTGNTSSAG
jgi:pimeloyl-ACP methyl ester carboxylesterase